MKIVFEKLPTRNNNAIIIIRTHEKLFYYNKIIKQGKKFEK